MGRPSSYTEQMADDICERISKGESLNLLCEKDAYPSQTTVYRWLEANEHFREKYTRARLDQADYYAQQIVDISNEQAVCYTESGNAYDPDVNRDRLRIDARKWFASKVAPKKYGDKITHSGDADNPLVVAGITLTVVDPRAT